MALDIDKISLDIADPSGDGDPVDLEAGTGPLDIDSQTIDDAAPIADESKAVEEKDKKDLEEPDDEVTSDEDDEDDEDVSAIARIAKQSGYDFGEELAEFEDSPEGLFKLSDKIAEKKFEERVERFMAEDPLAGEFYQYLRKGGDPTHFQEVYSQPDFTAITQIEPDDEALQEYLVAENLLADGLTEEQVGKAVERYKGAGLLQEEAERSLTKLQREQEIEREALMVEADQAALRREEETSRFFSEIKTSIDKSDNLNGLPITEKDKTPFFDYIAKVDDSGKTGYMKAVEQMTTEDLLTIQYLAFRGFKLSDFVARTAQSSQAKSLSAMLEGTRTGLKGSRQDRRKTSNGNVDNIELNLGI